MITIERAQKFAGLSGAVKEKLAKEAPNRAVDPRRSQEAERKQLVHSLS